MTAGTSPSTAKACTADIPGTLSDLRALLDQIESAAPEAAQGHVRELALKTKALCPCAKAGDDLEATANQAAQTVIRTVRAHPAKAALAVVGAVGAGVLAWWLLTRNRAQAE